MTNGNSLINLGELSKPATVLIEKISSAIGVIYEPTRIKRYAKAEADAHSITVLANLNLQSEVEKRGLQRLLAQQTRKQVNIENIIQTTVGQLPDNAEVESLEADWLANFFEKCENISNETMQNMWSGLLTSEATKPGTVSKKTINIISNIDKEDAETFTRFCQFVWHVDESKNNAIPILFNLNKNETFNEQGIYYQDLIELESIGLITLSGTETFAITNQPKKIELNYFDKLIQFKFEDEHDNSLPVGACLLTKPGIELFNICEANSNVKYLEHIIDYYREKNIIATDITEQS